MRWLICEAEALPSTEAAVAPAIALAAVDDDADAGDNDADDDVIDIDDDDDHTTTTPSNALGPSTAGLGTDLGHTSTSSDILPADNTTSDINATSVPDSGNYTMGTNESMVPGSNESSTNYTADISQTGSMNASDSTLTSNDTTSANGSIPDTGNFTLGTNVTMEPGSNESMVNYTADIAETGSMNGSDTTLGGDNSTLAGNYTTSDNESIPETGNFTMGTNVTMEPGANESLANYTADISDVGYTNGSDFILGDDNSTLTSNYTTPENGSMPETGNYTLDTNVTMEPGSNESMANYTVDISDLGYTSGSDFILEDDNSTLTGNYTTSDNGSIPDTGNYTLGTNVTMEPGANESLANYTVDIPYVGYMNGSDSILGDDNSILASNYTAADNDSIPETGNYTLGMNVTMESGANESLANYTGDIIPEPGPTASVNDTVSVPEADDNGTVTTSQNGSDTLVSRSSTTPLPHESGSVEPPDYADYDALTSNETATVGGGSTDFDAFGE